MNRLARIDKMDQRFSSYVSRTLTSLAKESGVLDELGKSYRLRSSGKARLTAGTADYLEDLAVARYTGIRRMTERLVQACAGHWGFPHDVTLKRLRMVTERAGQRVVLSDDPIWRAVPRRRLADLKKWEQERFPPAQFKNEGLTCHCRRCRVSTLCSGGHAVGAGHINCRWCDWVRHVGGAVRQRDRIRGRSERNQPLRFCRSCGFSICRCPRGNSSSKGSESKT